jgi:hypothetical protein
MVTNLVGTTVEFSLSGRAFGTVLRGVVLGFAPPGLPNHAALAYILEERPDLHFSRRHLRFNLKTASTYRCFVMVEQQSVYSKPIFHLYATNVLGIVPV